MRLAQQYIQRRDVGVPLDERWYRPEALQRIAVELPDFRADGAAMVVDHNSAMLVAYQLVPSQMDLCHHAGCDLVQPGAAMRQRIGHAATQNGIAGVDVDVVHVHDQAATGAPG